MSTRAIDFNSTAYAKTKSFIAKENAASIARAKESRKHVTVPPSGVKSSWTPLKQDLNEKLFEERKELVGNWFDRWTDVQRKTILEILVSKCKQPQLQYTFSLLDKNIPVTHIDFTRKLPRIITVYIFSFLDPRSLCRCAQVCWYWKCISELDQIWMPKCMRFNWLLPFVPSPFEQGVWKRHYLECVKGLQYVQPKSPPIVQPENHAAEKPSIQKRSKSMTNLSTRKLSKKGSHSDLPPWKSTSSKPTEIVWKSTREEGGCRRCHMSTHTTENHTALTNDEQSKKTSAGPKNKPRIRPLSGSFAPESEMTGTKFDMKGGRPDWAVQTSITPVSIKRPPPSVVKPSLQAMAGKRQTTHLPSHALFPSQPWRQTTEFDSDDDLI